MAKERILVVDDEPDIVKMLTLRLKSKGYEVIAAFDGLEALDKARNEKPDLIILDLRLPKMDGYQVCRLLKFDKKYGSIPVVMLTAKTQEVDKTTGYETGADAYVTKPFDAQSLMATIEKFLKVRSEAG